MEIRKGAIIHVRCRVLSFCASGNYYSCVTVAENGNVGNNFLVKDDKIVRVEPRTLEVGDRVNCRDFPVWNRAEIVAIDGSSAWIRPPSIGALITIQLTQLERVES